jgi:hypothetical protein
MHRAKMLRLVGYLRRWGLVHARTPRSGCSACGTGATPAKERRALPDRGQSDSSSLNIIDVKVVASSVYLMLQEMTSQCSEH